MKLSGDLHKAPSRSTGTEQGWGLAGDPNHRWPLEELVASRREINASGLELEAIENFDLTKRIDSGAGRWIKIGDYGRTLSGMRATGPVDAPDARPGKDSPCLEYRMYLFSTGEAEVMTITAPTLNFVPGRGLRFAISFDDAPPRTVTLVPENYSAQNGNRDWETSVKDNAHVVKTKFTLANPGYHTLKLWMVDPGVLLQKLVVDLGGLKPSYLGPPESYFNANPGPQRIDFSNRHDLRAATRTRAEQSQMWGVTISMTR